MTSNSLAVYTPEKQREVLTLLGLSGPSGHIQLLFQLAERYDLDPLTKEITLIPNKGPFIGVWGRLHIAHRSGLLDGLEMDDEWETEKHYCVRVIVWRKDMSHPAAKVIGRVGKHEGFTDKQGKWQPKEWPDEISRARGVRGGLGYAFSIHDIYDIDDSEEGAWQPPPDERLQASVVDVPAAVSPREEATTQPAAKPKRRVTKAARGSAADPDPTPGHTGAGSGPPPGSPAAGPTTPGAAEPQVNRPEAETVREASGAGKPAVGRTSKGPDPAAAPEQPTLDTDPPTLIVGGHILAQKIAIAARHAGIDDDTTRHDVIQAATNSTASRGKDVTEAQAERVLRAFAGLATGSVELRYKPDGTPTLIRPRRP